MLLFLPMLMPLTLIENFLPLFSFVIGLVVAKTNINYGIKSPKISYLRISSKFFSKKVLKTLGCL